LPCRPQLLVDVTHRLDWEDAKVVATTSSDGAGAGYVIGKRLLKRKADAFVAEAALQEPAGVVQDGEGDKRTGVAAQGRPHARADGSSGADGSAPRPAKSRRRWSAATVIRSQARTTFRECVTSCGGPTVQRVRVCVCVCVCARARACACACVFALVWTLTSNLSPRTVLRPWQLQTCLMPVQLWRTQSETAMQTSRWSGCYA